MTCFRGCVCAFALCASPVGLFKIVCLAPYGTNTARILNDRKRNSRTSSTCDTAILPCTLGNLPSCDRLTAAVSRILPLDSLTPVCYPTGTRCQEARKTALATVRVSQWMSLQLFEACLGPGPPRRTIATEVLFVCTRRAEYRMHASGVQTSGTPVTSKRTLLLR